MFPAVLSRRIGEIFAIYSEHMVFFFFFLGVYDVDAEDYFAVLRRDIIKLFTTDCE